MKIFFLLTFITNSSNIPKLGKSTTLEKCFILLKRLKAVKKRCEMQIVDLEIQKNVVIDEIMRNRMALLLGNDKMRSHKRKHDKFYEVLRVRLFTSQLMQKCYEDNLEIKEKIDQCIKTYTESDLKQNALRDDLLIIEKAIKLTTNYFKNPVINKIVFRLK